MGLINADVIISGWNGKMGQALRRLSHSYFQGQLHNFKELRESHLSESVVWIDFSNKSAFNDVVDKVVRYKCPLVMGTTGLSKDQISRLKVLSKTVPVVYDANFSLGIHILRRLIRALPSMHGFDVSVYESHHLTKKDSPSGTAKNLRRDLQVVLKINGDIPILSHRGGGIRGEHEIIFSGNNEVLTLKHEVLDRTVFAEGALSAAVWVLDKPCGYFSMEDCLS